MPVTVAAAIIGVGQPPTDQNAGERRGDGAG
jgi:hypothetical protein